MHVDQFPSSMVDICETMRRRSRTIVFDCRSEAGPRSLASFSISFAKSVDEARVVSNLTAPDVSEGVENRRRKREAVSTAGEKIPLNNASE